MASGANSENYLTLQLLDRYDNENIKIHDSCQNHQNFQGKVSTSDMDSFSAVNCTSSKLSQYKSFRSNPEDWKG